ncbi:MAG: hypothetical protein JOZ07_12010 [Solirubrobacterales bacterium]|nr:hypothetical protein [Solirubrobacterales bacterium]
MRELSRESEEVTIVASLQELRLLLGTLNEALNGAFAIPDEDWDDLIGQPTGRASELADRLAEILER